MSEPTRRRSWPRKFHAAFVGAKLGVRGQSSFFVHFFVATMVIVAALILRVSAAEWCLLVLAITLVLTAEMFNSALEWLARAITDEDHAHIAGALDIASAAVLIAALGAVAIGLLVFVPRFMFMLGL